MKNGIILIVLGILLGIPAVRLFRKRDSDFNRMRIPMACICALFCAFGLFSGIGLSISEINQDETDGESDYSDYSNSIHERSYSYSQTTSKQTQTKSEKDRQREKIERTAEYLEADGQLVIWSGYTFDECVKKAKVYLETNYNTWFYDTSVLVSTEDMLYNYFVIGYDHNGKSFEVWITHYDGVWGIVTATIED